MTGLSWRVVRRRSDAAAFHRAPIPEPATPEIWVHDVTRPALVLGSTQRGDGIADVAACERAGVDIVRRRSGGGAVLLVPAQVVWVDVILPAGHLGWSNDIHRPMMWLGERMAAAFAAAGVAGTSVHRGALVQSDHSRLICFDGLGPGELTLDGAKLVGISQRRTRDVARLQCCWYTSYEPGELTALLVDPPDLALLNPVATVSSSTGRAVVDCLAEELNGSSSSAP
ncbi:MAG: hypothetical protein AB8G14_09535 [Ilumatobacter sp.]